MATIDLKNLSIKSAREAITRGDFTALQLTEAYLEKIAKDNPNLNAYLEVFADAREQAMAVDAKIKAGEPVGALAGIPIAIKDNILIKGKIASAASKILQNYRATYDATVIEKLKEAGAVLIGRTNMDEFAFGSSTENSAFGPTKNPHDLSRVPGGTSGGSTAAVADSLALVALGSDTGGSIRQPSSFCGVIGLKPTYGAVSRFGLIADASSLDQIGPIAKTIEDAETLFEVIKGKDQNDSTSAELVETKTVLKKKLGVPFKFIEEGLDAEVRANFDATLEKFKTAGYEIVDVDLSVFKYSLPCYYIIQPAEASTNLARFDGLRYGDLKEGKSVLEEYLQTRTAGFGKETRRRLMLGTYVLSAGYYDAYYNRAVKVRRLIKEAYAKAFEGVDAILTPVAPTPAWVIGEKGNDPLKMYLEDIFTVPASLAGIPAMSVPTGETEDGLPLGIQIAAPHFREDILFALGKEIE